MTSSSTSNEVSNVRFRLIGINQDNRADGTGKAGLTFQAISYYNIRSKMNTVNTNAGGWRDSQLRKNLNDESTGTIWNAIQSTDFKNNIAPVLKTTNNNFEDGYNNYKTSNESSTTIDKLWILSPSEMGMPIIKNYNVIHSYFVDHSNANVHYYDSNSYKNTIKSSNDGSVYKSYYDPAWLALYSYLYAGNAYQWWMLPAGNRIDFSSEQQAYHNNDSYSYCALADSRNPSTYKDYFNTPNDRYSYWLRSLADENFLQNTETHTSGFLISILLLMMLVLLLVFLFDSASFVNKSSHII